MFAARKTDSATAAGPATYIEDVFSTNPYTGNGSVQTISNGIAIGGSYGGSVYFSNFPYLTAGPNVALNLTGNNFTIEWFFRATSLAAAEQFLISQSSNLTDYVGIRLQTDQLSFFASNGSRILSGGTILLDTWYHVAVTRSSTTTRLFVNGVLRQSTTASVVLYDNFPWAIGARTYPGNETSYFSGFISNVRIVKGTAVYTANFTPPTLPLTATANTSLLTCQVPNTLLDYSSNSFTITNTNSAIAQNGGGPFTDSAANKGGLVWLKGRSGATDHALYDTTRGATFDLVSNSTTAQTTQTTGLTSFNANGFSIGTLAKLNTNAATYTSWTFRKQAKFFDVVTYTGTGTARTVSHNLGSVPGMIIVKRNGAIGEWNVYHRSLATNQYLTLESTASVSTSASYWNNTAPTSTEFSVSSVNNTSSNTYVAYLFAHDAGGFGASGTDNVISCGSYTGNGSATGPTVTLGYEPQWILIKRASTTGSGWILHDTMRGLATGGNSQYLQANVADAEAGGANYVDVNATGFQIKTTGVSWNVSGTTYIYIAIRRGPMKTPTSGTSVFTPIKTGSGATLSDSYSSIGFPIDMTLRYQTGTDTTAAYKNAVYTRLLGINSGTADTPTSSNNPNLLTHSTAATVTTWYYSQTGSMSLDYGGSWTSPSYVLTHLHFRRAPGFFDVVCYTGTGSNTTQTHNLAVVPELILVKGRSAATAWQVYSSSLANTEYLVLNTTAAKATGATRWNSTTPTSSVFSLGTASEVNTSAATYMAYLFASLTGVSKVGSYTGNGSSQTINCGFAAGARFIMIKRTDSTGDWYVWDTARGIVSGNDPRLSLNTTAAEVTTDDSIDPDNSGFIVNQVAATNINVSSATYIYLAIA